MKQAFRIILTAFTLAAQIHAGELEENFAMPPDSARPWVYWFWSDGNITKAGVTADLEAMKRVGIGGVLIMEVTQGVPPGPVRFGSPQWRELFKFVLAEADRLGLKVNVNNGAGWAGSGGPWITPELSQKKMVWAETAVVGGKTFEGRLPQPETVMGFYRDIAALAFPTPVGEDRKMTAALPRITASAEVKNFAAGKLADHDPKTLVVLPPPKKGRLPFIQLEFSQPFMARSLDLVLGGRPRGNYHGLIQVSDDGMAFRTVREFDVTPPGSTVSFNGTSARCFRVAFASGIQIAELGLSPRASIENVQAKAAFTPQCVPLAAAWPEVPAELTIPHGRVLDLTAKLDRDGKLNWNPPPGHWTVLRLGYTTLGHDNHPAPKEGRGLECDKLNQAGAEAMFAGLIGKLAADSPTLAGKTLVSTHIDSWEVGPQNWTQGFREEFQKRRGYDLLPFLPAVTGRVVDSLEISERFLWDLRQTISDLLVENYAGHLCILANRHGMRLSIEAYDLVPAAEMTYAGQADEPMAEFWSHRSLMNSSCAKMSSAAHVYGKKIIGAEAFTSGADEKWLKHPANIKELGDWALCEGINRFVFHRYAMQPWLDIKPGMTMGPWGLHYERTQTWWEWSRPWHEYLARCQFLLRQGLFVADILCLEPEGAPMRFIPPTSVRPDPYERGAYNFDGCTPEALLTRVSVKDGRLVLPDGMSYRMLVLPEAPTMTPKLLRKIKELVAAGATVVGNRPVKSPSLTDYPQCDAEVKQLVDELWGDCDGKTIAEHRLGRGRVVCGKTPKEVLGGMGVGTDFSFQSKTPDAGLRYIHRTADESEIYFVANNKPQSADVVCTFRVAGKQPEFWWPDTGRMERAAVYEERDGVTRLPLRLDAVGSVFVVFRKAVGSRKPEAGMKNWLEFAPAQEIAGAWEVSFDPKWGGPAKPVTFVKLEDWTKRAEEAVRYYSGPARYRKTITVASDLAGNDKRLFLDLGKVSIMAEVKLNGKDLGILWKPPFRVEITSAVKPGDNALEIKVVNLWVNRMIGDEQLPEDSDRNLPGAKKSGFEGTLKQWPQWLQAGKPSPAGRHTFTTWRLWKKDDPLQESGLLGPVTLQSQK